MPPWVKPISIPTPYPVGPVTAYLLEGDPLTLIDTGPATRRARQALFFALRTRGYRVRDVQRVLLTHGHHDHFGQASWLAARGAEVWAHPDDADNLSLRRHRRFLLAGLIRAGIPVQRCAEIMLGLWVLDLTARRLERFRSLADGDELDHSRTTIRVHHHPGHSPGHVGFELVAEGVLVAGDTVLDGISPNAVVGPDPRRPGKAFLSLAAYAGSLERIRELAPRLVLPAHGPCVSDVRTWVDSAIARQEMRLSELRAALGSTSATTARLMETLFPGTRLTAAFLVYSEVLGHLMELERRGEVERLNGGRRDRWHLVREARPDASAR